MLIVQLSETLNRSVDVHGILPLAPLVWNFAKWSAVVSETRGDCASS